MTKFEFQFAIEGKLYCESGIEFPVGISLLALSHADRQFFRKLLRLPVPGLAPVFRSETGPDGREEGFLRLNGVIALKLLDLIEISQGIFGAKFYQVQQVQQGQDCCFYSLCGNAGLREIGPVNGKYTGIVVKMLSRTVRNAKTWA